MPATDSKPLPIVTDVLPFQPKDGSEKIVRLMQQCSKEDGQELLSMVCASAASDALLKDAIMKSAAVQMYAALNDLVAFVCVMLGRGADAVIPETVGTPLGVSVKVGAIMRDAQAALAKAEGRS